MLRWVRRLIGALAAAALVLATIPPLGLAYGFLTTGPARLASPAPTAPQPNAEVAARLAGAGGYKRRDNAPFRSYLSWWPVFAARDYAALTERELPQNFPYWAYVGRFWQDYALMIRVARGSPFTQRDHLPLMQTGIGLTVNHIAQWTYENTAGRISAAIAGAQPVEQDAYLARSAAAHAAFLSHSRWFDYDYGAVRAGLWATKDAPDIAMLRSWERKLAFGLAYTAQQVVAALFRTEPVSQPELNIWAQGPVAEAIGPERDISIIQDLTPHGAHLVTRLTGADLDRLIIRLALRGVRFAEIAGIRTTFLTVTSGREVAAPEGTQIIFGYPLPAEPARQRVGMAINVALLHEVLPALAAQGAEIEHIYID